MSKIYFKHNIIYTKNASLILNISPENDIKTPLKVSCRVIQARKIIAIA